MSEDDDDEALTWAGGRDPSHFETPVIREPREKRVRRAPDAPEPGASESDDAAAELPPVTSSALLVTLGILGGVYLLYTIGWIVSLQRLSYVAANALDGIAFTTQQYLAILAPALWFTTVMLSTRGRKPLVRLLWLLAGAAVLVPWPFVWGS